MKAAMLISTKQFDALAEELLDADQLAELEFSLAINPMAHPVIPGTNGVRKARWSRTGNGQAGWNTSDLLLRHPRRSDSPACCLYEEPKGQP